MKSENIFCLRSAKTNLVVYKIYVEVSKELNNSWHIVEKPTMCYSYMQISHNYQFLPSSSFLLYVKWLLDVMYLVIIKMVPHSVTGI
jgi:hypothetical protein